MQIPLNVEADPLDQLPRLSLYLVRRRANAKTSEYER